MGGRQLPRLKPMPKIRTVWGRETNRDNWWALPLEGTSGPGVLDRIAVN
jgi:hypothetical protein